MTNAQMVTRIEELKNLEELISRAKAKADTIKDELKAEMLERDTEELVIESHIIRFTSVVTNKFDVSGFKKLYPSMWADWIKVINSRRFTIS